MMKLKRFIKYLGLDGKWHKIQVGKTAKVSYHFTHDVEAGKEVTIITKGAQTFKVDGTNYKFEWVQNDEK